MCLYLLHFRETLNIYVMQDITFIVTWSGTEAGWGFLLTEKAKLQKEGDKLREQLKKKTTTTNKLTTGELTSLDSNIQGTAKSTSIKCSYK